MLRKTFCCAGTALLLSLASGLLSPAEAQVSGPPSANCHVTDGQFTSCPNGTTEWSDVQPVAFPASNSYLYVNQDPAHAFLYLMYDLPVRTTALAAADSVHINFDTVETVSNGPALVVYDIYIFGNGQMQVLQQGKPTPQGRIVGGASFGVSPNSATPHVMAELQVPLLAGPPSTYSSDPLFWGLTVPPTPPPPPAPPTCPVGVLGVCIKTRAEIAAWKQIAAAANATGQLIMSRGQAVCELIDPVAGLAAAEGLYEESLATLGVAAQALQTNAALRDFPGVINAVNGLLHDISGAEAAPLDVATLEGQVTLGVAAVQIAAVAALGPGAAAALANFTVAATFSGGRCERLGGDNP